MGFLKWVNMAFCGIRSVNLHEDTIKILGIHCSYNKQLKNDENSKLLPLSKITQMALLKTLPPSVIDQLNKTE